MTSAITGISIIAAISFAALFVVSRRRLQLRIKVERFLDSYEYQDFESIGRVRKDYYAWKGDELVLPVKVHIEKESAEGIQIAHGSYIMEFQIKPITIPEGFEICLKPPDSMEAEFSPRYPINVKFKPKANNTELTFFIVVRRLDSTRELHHSESLTFDLRGVAKSTGLLPVQTASCRTQIDCFLGPDLGKVWVALDPGTIGSCICAGSSQYPQKLYMEEEEDKSARITPSVITFNRELEPEHVKVKQGKFEIIDPSLYRIGYEAQAEMGLKKNIAFQSIKKLLGYKDTISINFANDKELIVNGEILSGLLVKGIFENFKSYVEKSPGRYSELCKSSKFNPIRAVVAVPNNFTAVKIIDMVNCLKDLNRFKEIRYITEAESILCYYIFNRRELSSGSKEKLDETILVFDMGGATINATVADVFQKKDNNRQIRYHVEIDSQIGYSVGGDTIDYCIAKTILSFKHEIPELKAIDPFSDKDIPEEDRKELAKKIQGRILELKKLIIQRYYGDPLIMSNSGELSSRKAANVQDIVELLIPKSSEGEFHVLLTPAELEDFINSISDTPVSINMNSDIFKQFRSDGLGEYPIFGNDFFQKYVYLPVREATEDALKLSEGEGGFLDTVIFTGRSSLFPRVKETVVEIVRQVDSKVNPGKKINPEIIRNLGGKELKTAVVQGACLYGIYSNVIELSSEKLNSTFGVKQTLSASKKDFKFHELISIGSPFINDDNGGSKSTKGLKNFSDPFHFDGRHVNFFQIMGRDALSILSEDQKHKYSMTASIPLNFLTDSFGIKVSQNGYVEAFVKTVNGQVLVERHLIADQEVREANEEHYTWVVG